MHGMEVRTTQITVRVSPSEKARFNAYAASEEKETSQIIRDWFERAIKRAERKAVK